MSAIVQSSGITGLSPAQLLAGAKEPPKRRRDNGVLRMRQLLDDEDLVVGQIAGEEREITRFISMAPNFSDPMELEPRCYIETKMPGGKIRRTAIQPTPGQRYGFLK